MAMAVQRWGWQWWWRRSNGVAAMVEAAQQWWWTEAIVMYHRIVSYSVFVYHIDILRSFLRRPHTDKFPDDVPKKLRRNRNRDSCEKAPQERKTQESGGFLQEYATSSRGLGLLPAFICFAAVADGCE